MYQIYQVPYCLSIDHLLVALTMLKNWVVVFLASVIETKSIVDNRSVVSRLGNSVVLLCPYLNSSICSSSTCSWSGPANLTCSSYSCDPGLEIVFNTSSCECMLAIHTTSQQHKGDWQCHVESDVFASDKILDDLDYEIQNATNAGTFTIGKNNETEENMVDVKILRTVKEERRKSIFYVVFFSLAILAKLLLVVVIIFSIMIAFCKGGRIRRPALYPLPSIRRNRYNDDHILEDHQEDKVFNGRICQLKSDQ